MPDSELVQLWQETLNQLEQDLPRPSFETWLRNTHPVSLTDSTLVIGVPNEFARDWVEKRYSAMLTAALHAQAGTAIELRFVIPDNQPPAVSAPPHIQPESRTVRTQAACELNPRYTFDTFVIGASNRFAHAASLAVSASPARAYNPLFIYGGVGLGKTHLMQAIGHYVLSQHHPLRVVYVSSETFTNELINAIRDRQTVSFRNRYRGVDVLLIDDIQFLAGKESTQEEFFHTFNSLSSANKQIVVSSDRPPKEIPTLEQRLRSRFEGGLIADIQPPDLETRMAILRNKAAIETTAIPDTVLLYVATKIDTNIRELEGALIRLVAFSSITSQPVTLDLAAEALKDLLPGPAPQSVSIDLIQEIVASHYGVTVLDLKIRKRTRALSYPRQIAMYLARSLTDYSLPRIGEAFGGRDHTTVLHACEKISRELDTDPSLHAVIEKLTDRIRCS